MGGTWKPRPCVSIPYSSIKSCTRQHPRTCYAAVSIPYSSIKRELIDAAYELFCVSIPYSSIKRGRTRRGSPAKGMFQFHIVRLKVVPVYVLINAVQFQFHIVRLKVFQASRAKSSVFVSIPYSSIKSKRAHKEMQGLYCFNSIQFD